MVVFLSVSIPIDVVKLKNICRKSKGLIDKKNVDNNLNSMSKTRPNFQQQKITKMNLRKRTPIDVFSMITYFIYEFFV
jgi:3-methyladenine DNA glycosylase AlkC